MENQNNQLLASVREGMEVYARDGKKIGTVETVQFGQEDPAAPGPETATVHEQDTGRGSLVENFAEALGAGEELPEVFRARLLRNGYVKVDAGLLASDRYVMADQIAAVAGDRVELHVSKDELIAI